MRVAVDFRNTYNSHQALRMFTKEFWQDMVTSQPNHDFVFITGDNPTMENRPENLQLKGLKKINIAWIDEKRLKNMLLTCAADRLVTVQESGFVISPFQPPQNKAPVDKLQKQVSFTGSMPSGTPPGENATIQPVLRSVITSLTWAETESIKTQYTGGRSFFLFTEDIDERHQLVELLKAFSAFKKWQQSNMQLVIAGSATAWTDILEEKLATYKYKEDVVLLKNMQHTEIAKLVAACYLLVYPVTGNVFPLALLWALQSNKAVIATDNAMNRQVTDAAAWVAPGDTAEGFAKAMILLFKDEQQQQLLVQQGKLLHQGYSRRQMLERAWQCIEQ